MEANKYAELLVDETARMSVIHKSSKRPYNESMTRKTTTNTGKIQK